MFQKRLKLSMKGDSSGESKPPKEDDIALLTNKTSLTQLERKKILQEIFVPGPDYKFPVTSLGTKQRKFQISWLQQYKWLSYSESKDKAFCKFCVAFNANEKGRGASQSSALNNNGFGQWVQAKQKFDSHQATKFHGDAAMFSENFLKSLQDGSNILSLIHKRRSKEVEENKSVLRSIIQTIIFCGRQCIALRGHTDTGRVTDEDPEHNDGNFRSLLRFRMNSGDTNLLNHTTFGKSNAQYTSPGIQNHLITLCGQNILEKIISKIHRAKLFSILVDETTDVSTTEQVSLSVRYIDPDTFDITEDFLSFTAVDSTTGKSLTQTITSQIAKLNLNINFMRGQSYDGAANMSGKFAGVKTRLQNKYPTALYTYCANHKLNLVISDSCSIPEVRNCFGIIKEVQSFFSRSPKRTEVLKSCILDGKDVSSKKTKLISMCDTRWVERHDSLSTFSDLFIYIISSLEHIEKSGDTVSQIRSNMLLKSLQTSSFLVALKCSELILSLTVIASKALQNPQIDLHKCYEMIVTLMDTLGSIKENSAEEFKKVFLKVHTIATFSGVEIRLPRLTPSRKEELCKENPTTPMDNPEDYFHVTIFKPFLMHTISSIQTRFDVHQSCINSLFVLIPKYAIHIKEDTALTRLKEFYHDDLCVIGQNLESEFKLWAQKWKNTKEIHWPNSLVSLLKECDNDFFPSIYILLQILCTLPVTTATSERSFSALKRLKTYTRNTIGENRLNGLALLNVHRDVECNVDEVLNNFALEKSHKIPLL